MIFRFKRASTRRKWTNSQAKTPANHHPPHPPLTCSNSGDNSINQAWDEVFSDVAPPSIASRCKNPFSFGFDFLPGAPPRSHQHRREGAAAWQVRARSSAASAKLVTRDKCDACAAAPWRWNSQCTRPTEPLRLRIHLSPPPSPTCPRRKKEECNGSGGKFSLCAIAHSASS